MRILFLTDGLFPFQIGGMQKHSSVLVKLLSLRGINLTVIHPGGKDFSEEKLKQYFGESENLKFICVPFPVFRKIPGHYIRANRAYSKAAFEAVQQVLGTFDLIYAQGFTGSEFIFNGGTLGSLAPVCVNLHGYGEFFKAPDIRTAIQYRMLRPLMRELSTKADFVYSFGGKISEKLVQFGVKKDQILLNSNGIEVEFLNESVTKASTVKRFIFIGRNELRKGVGEIFLSIRKLITSGQNFEFNFVGFESDQMSDIQNVHFYGEIRDSKRVMSLLDQCDCLVLPSYAEGMPTVILEAMARGLAIIGTNVGAVSRMIDGNGILLDHPNEEKLTDALRKVIEMDEDKLNRWKQKSLILVKEKFLWSKVVEEKIRDFCRITGKKI